MLYTLVGMEVNYIYIYIYIYVCVCVLSVLRSMYFREKKEIHVHLSFYRDSIAAEEISLVEFSVL